jgi:hypothetical protein
MANPERGEIALKVQDREYTLVLDFEAYCIAERFMSKDEGRTVSFPEIWAGVMVGSWRHVRGLLCGAFTTHQPDMTPEQVGKVIVAAGGPKAILETIGELKELSGLENKSRPRKARQRKNRKAGARISSTREGSASQPATSGG